MSLYLLINLAAVSIPFIFSFHPRLTFFKSWPYFFPAMAITATFFISWDIAFTHMGVWGFNATFLLGIYLAGLPVEEWLFFLCIPYACVFTYEALGKLNPNFSMPRSLELIITIALVAALLLTSVLNLDKWYTSTAMGLAGISLVLVYSFLREILSRFYLSYLVLLIPFFIVNGILTGSFIHQEVVWYNDLENLSIRLFTVPVEDIFYGMALILWNVALTTLFRRAS